MNMKKRIAPLMLTAALTLSAMTPMAMATDVDGQTDVYAAIAANAKIVTYNVTVPTTYAFVVNAKFDAASDTKVKNEILAPGTIAGEDGSVQELDAPKFLNGSYTTDKGVIEGTQVTVKGTLEAQNVSAATGAPTKYAANLWRPVTKTVGDDKSSKLFQYTMSAGGQAFDDLIAQNENSDRTMFASIKLGQKTGFTLAAPTEKTTDEKSFVPVPTPADFAVKVVGIENGGVNSLEYWKLVTGDDVATEGKEDTVKSVASAEIASISWDVTLPTTTPAP